MRGGTWLGHLPLPLVRLVGLLLQPQRDDDHDNDDDCRFVETAADATVIHTTLCHRPLGSVDQSDTDRRMDSA